MKSSKQTYNLWHNILKVRKKQEEDWIVLFVSFSKCWKTWLEIWAGGAREDTKQFLTSSSHNTEVIKSLALPRDFTIITLYYKLFKDTSKRLPCWCTHAQDFLALGHYLKTSFLKDNSKRLHCSITTDWDFLLLNHNWLRLLRCSRFHQETYLLKHTCKRLSKSLHK